MATDKKKAEKNKEEVALQTVVPPGALVAPDYGDDAGAGFEHQTAADVTIPFIIVLQSGSPQVKDRAHPMALDGNLYNTVTEQYYDRDQGLLFVPATTRQVYTMWVPRDQGGGFRGHLEPDDDRVTQAVKDAVKFGKYQVTVGDEILQLVECFYVYGAECDEEGNAVGMALLACTSTKITPYKKWNSRLRKLALPPTRAPMCANLTRVVSDLEKNNQGSFFVFGFKPGDPRGMLQSLLRPDDPRFMLAKACRELVDSGAAKVDFEKQGGDDGDSSTGKAPF